MSKQEYKSIEKELQSVVIKTKNDLSKASLLEEKINFHRQLKLARENLRQHKLRYFDFI